MKIAIFSDWHLGYKWGGELQTDSYAQLEQALKQIQEKNVDLILCAGDLFDKKEPSPDEIYEAIRILKKCNIQNKIGLKNGDEILKIPMISIVGNHEYRGQDYKSVVHLLEISGYLKFLHLNSVNLKTENEKDIEIFGISGIPDKYAKGVLQKWNPEINNQKYNILIMHQTIKDYVPFDDEMISSISISDLPKEYDLIINGHIHTSVLENINQKQKLLLPGSTIYTQSKKIESKKPKKIYILDTKINEIKSYEIKNTRKVYYLDLKVNKKSTSEIRDFIIKNIEDLINNKSITKDCKKPIVRIRLKGKLKDRTFSKNINLKDIIENYKEKAYLNIVNKLKETKLKESIKKLKEENNQTQDIEKKSKEIFNEIIKKTEVSKDFDYNRIYNILENKDFKEKIKTILENV